MKDKYIKNENELIIDLDTVYKNYKFENDIIKSKRIYEEIFTDGEVLKLGKTIESPIKKYSVKFKRYHNPIDTIETNRYKITNYTYAIKLTLFSYLINNNEKNGWYDSIANSKIILKNEKDKEALIKAKQTLLEYDLKATDSSYLDIIFHDSHKKYEYSYELPNVYKLKK